MDILLFLLLLIFLIIVLIDTIPEFNTWQSRIHIGRFENKEIWQHKVLKLSGKWLRNTPTIPLTDNKRLIFIDILRENYKRSAIQSWQEGALVLGLTEYLKSTPDEKVQRQLEDFADKKMTLSGQWKEKPNVSDHALLAYAILNADFANLTRFRPAFDETYDMIKALKGEDGSVAYKKHNANYRFVDTVGFICPFLVTYGMKFRDSEAVELGIQQILEYQKYGMMPDENIPCHTYLTESKMPAGLYGWGRGFGWFALGLIDSWNVLAAGHPQKAVLREVVVKTARSAMKFQRESGAFNWLLFVKESRLDSSTTAALCWFFTLAAQIPEIAEQCLAARESGLKYLQSVTRRNGAVDFSQGDTKGIGVYSQNFDLLPFTQGLVLRTLNYKADFNSQIVR